MTDHYNQNYQNLDRKINRVYINPNFNRPDNFHTSSSSMYFNPNYLHGTPNLNNNKQEPKDQASIAKIHVNPNFFRNPNVYNPIVARNSDTCLTNPSNSVSSSVNYPLSKGLSKEEFNKNMTAQSMHISKSRYCLVRQKENVISTAPISRPVTTTVKVNKYKSLSLNAVKNILATVKPTKSTIESSFSQNVKYKTSGKPILTGMNNTRFKFVKSNMPTVLNQSDKKATKYPSGRRSSLLNKSLQKTSSRNINNKLVLKKNNIPCPLFKKYGKCLRKIRGSCEYLHDKNHVSICRKFLRGICHDDDCLLSHDLTDKKMPTCYFYLQGACTKETCPYLHVKLNEKTKICQDFLKGYCENGDKCLFRHINVCQELASKKACSKKLLAYSLSSTSKTNYVVKVKSRKKSLVMLDQHRNAGRKDEPAVEQRYFKELVQDKSSVEKCDTMIKPSRIKLGTLPSFIQL